MNDKTIIIKGKLYYANTYCKCNCNSRIPVPETEAGLKNHKYRGLPDYIKGHGGYKFEIGNTINLGKEHTKEWKQSKSESMIGSKHFNYNGGQKIAQARKNNVKDNKSSNFLNTPNNVANEQHHLFCTNKEWVVWEPKEFHEDCYHGPRCTKEQKEMSDAIALMYLEEELNHKYKLELYGRETGKGVLK